MNEKTKREQHMELTKESIAEVAGQLISEKGIANVAFDDIAKAAGYSRTTVYSYFTCKDDIINHMILRTFRMIHEIMLKVIKQMIPADQQLRYLSYELINLCNEKPFYYKCMLEYIDTSPDGRKQNPVLEEIYQFGEKLNEDFARIIIMGVNQGIFRDDLKVKPTGLILWSFLTTLISLVQNKQKYIENEMLSTQDFLDYGFTLLLRIIIK